MPAWICTTCGTQFPPAADTPLSCPICEDDRQYLPRSGQAWTTLEGLQRQGFRNAFTLLEPGLLGIRTEPRFAIGQQPLLVQTPEGNLLWDCQAFIDPATARIIEALGGLRAIAISHPHYYSTMREWAERFQVPVYIHEAERPWVVRPGEHVHYWRGEELPLWAGLTLVRLGGHFPGAAVLHWREGAGGRGVLLTGDTISVTPGQDWVTFMYSYPNEIPLPVEEVRRIAEKAASYPFERLYNAFDRSIQRDAREVVLRSADRYIEALQHNLADKDGRQ